MLSSWNLSKDELDAMTPGFNELAEGFSLHLSAAGGAAPLHLQPHELLPQRAAAPSRLAEDAVGDSVQTQRTHGEKSLTLLVNVLHWWWRVGWWGVWGGVIINTLRAIIGTRLNNFVNN